MRCSPYQAEQMRQSCNQIAASAGSCWPRQRLGWRAICPHTGPAESEWRLAFEAGGFEWPGAEQALAPLSLVVLLTDAPEAAEAMARQGLDVMKRVVTEWSWLLPIALAKQGRIDEASMLADAFAERFTAMGAEGRSYRGVALSIARRSRTSQGSTRRRATRSGQSV